MGICTKAALLESFIRSRRLCRKMLGNRFSQRQQAVCTHDPSFGGHSARRPSLFKFGKHGPYRDLSQATRKLSLANFHFWPTAALRRNRDGLGPSAS